MAFAPILLDGFDNYKSIKQRWTVTAQNDANNMSMSTTASRHSWGQGLSTGLFQPEIETPNVTHIKIKGAFNLNGGGGGTAGTFLRVGKLAVTTKYHVSFRISESRHVYFVDEQTSAVIAGPTTGPDKIVEYSNWYWFQFEVLMGGAGVGAMSFSVNGNMWLEALGVKTANTTASDPSIDTVRLNSSISSFYVDDMVFQDGATGDWQGDMVVLGKRTAAAGSSADLTVVGAANGWSALDEVLADDDTRYVHSDVVGERDSFQIAKITEVPGSSIVLATQQSYRHRKDQAGPRSVIPFTRVASDEVQGPEDFPSETAYLTRIVLDPLILQPDGATAWGDVDNFNALDVEIGHEVAAG